MNAPEYFIDSNVFIRIFVKDNAKMFADSREFISAVRQKGIRAVSSGIVLAEVQWALGSFYVFPKSRVVQALKSIASLAEPSTDASVGATAVALYEGHNVKFVDALIASHPRVQDGSMAIVSYDKDFDALGVRRMEPREALKKGLR